MSNINKLYNIWVKNENLISGTYGNVSILTQAKGEINTLTTSSLGVGCADPSINYILDVSGNQRTRGTLDISGAITSPWLDASLNARGYDASCVHLSGDELIGNIKSFTSQIKCNAISSYNTTNSFSINSVASSVVFYRHSFRLLNPNNVGRFEYYPEYGTGPTQDNVKIYDIAFRSNKIVLTDVANTEISTTELSYLDGVSSNIQSQLNGCVKLSGNQSISGTKTFTDGLTARNNLVVYDASGIQQYFVYSPSGKQLELTSNFRIYDNSFATPNIAVDYKPEFGLRVNRDFQVIGADLSVADASGINKLNYSISSGDIFELASNFRIYDNSFATPNIAVDYKPEFGLRVFNDVLFKGGGFQYLNSDGSTNLIFGNPQGTIQSKTSKHWYTANQTVITGTYTVPKPWDEYYGIDISGSAYTITLPTITDIDAGNPITFRKVIQTGASFNISFEGNGTQRLFSNSLTGSTGAVAAMTSTVFYITFVPMWDKFENDWGWFRVV